MRKLVLPILAILCINFLPIFSQDFFGQLPYPDGLTAQVSAVDSSDILYVGLWGKGLKKSLDGGTSWTDANTGLTNFFFNDIFVSSDSKIYVSTMGGIFLSTNQGASWTTLNNGLGILNVTCVRQYKTGMLIAGTYGQGIYISTNGGALWTQSNTGLPYRAISSIEISKVGYILASTYGSGVYQSHDTAKTWQRANTGITNKYVKSLVRIPIYPQIYAATNGGGVFMSPNEGISWGEAEDTTGLLDYGITALVIDDDMEEIIGTRNAGIQYFDKYLWNQWRTPFQSNVGITTLTRSKSGTIYSFGNESQPMRSTNNGRNWTQMTSLRNQTPIKFFTWGNGNIIAQYAPETIKYSSDYGKTWQNTDLGSKTLKTACSVENNIIFVGTDSGLFKSTNGINWTSTSITNPVTGIDYKSGLIAFGTATIPSGTPPPPPTYSFYISNDYGVTFTKKTYPTDSAAIVRIKVSSDGYIYMTMGNNLWRSSNQGGKWENVTNGLGGSINDLALNSSNAIYIATAKGVYHSESKGNFWTYSEVDYKNIDSIGASKINITGENTIYLLGNIPRSLSMSYGLWRSTDNGASWDSLYEDITSANNIDLSSDGESNLYCASTSIFKHLNPNQMVFPTNLAPANNQKSADLVQNFIWTSTSKAELYEWQLSESPTFEILKSWVVQSDTSYKETLEYNKTYYWRVRAKYHDSYSSWSSVFTFSTLLNAPTLVAPVNNSLGLSLNPTFVWNKVANADYYHLQLAIDDKFATLIMDSDSLADTTLVSQTLQLNQKYYWRVKAFNQFGESAWSDTWNFQTTFGAPVLIAPHNDSLDVPLNGKLVWGKVESATFYNVMLSDTSDFSNAKTFKVTGATSFDLQSNIIYDKDYYWKVQAANPNQTSNYSDPWHFASIIGPLNLLQPANDSKNISQSPDFSWTPNNKYNSYEFVISKQNTFQPILVDTVITSPNLTLNDLEGYTKYYWKVRVKNTTRQGEYSQIWNFTTGIAPVGLRYPTNNSKDNKTTIQFLWFPTNGAKYYFLQVARDIKFNDLIISKDSIETTYYEVKNLLPKTTYFWRVRASNIDGTSSWSQVWIFQTGSPVPILRYPENQAYQVPLEVTFLWDSLDNATSYFLQVSTDETFNQLIQSIDNIPTNSQNVTGLQLNTIYYWRVRAKFGDIDGDWSDMWSFQTITSGVFEYSGNDEVLSIYPNPVNSILYLNINLTIPGNCEVYIHDEYSRLIKILYKGSSELLNGIQSFNLNGLASGVYFLELKTENKIFVRKFIILK